MEFPMDATWIVSANAGRARFFAQARPVDNLEEINDMVSPAARNREGEIETDRMGQRAAAGSKHNVGMATTSSDYQPHQTPKQHEAELFARDVAHFLKQAQNEGRFDKLCLVASPEFLGVLRKELDGNLGRAVALEIDKDLTHASAQELRDRLTEGIRKH
jgi:protein required for attachment to host cells